MVRTLWAPGTSSGDIARVLENGASRNATMGMINRLGLMGLGHADAGRMKAIAKVQQVMDEPFCLGRPLHREALLALRVGSCGRDADALALATGVSRPECAAFLQRLPLVWKSGRMPIAWQGSLEGVLAFILDMAVIAGTLQTRPVRGSAQDNSEDDPPLLAA